MQGRRDCFKASPFAITAIAFLLLLNFECFALNPKHFTETTLQKFEEAHKADGPGLQFASPPIALSIQGSTSLKFRPMSDGVNSFLLAYVNFLKDPVVSSNLSLYKEEVLVNELGSGREIWLPIQKVVAEAMKNEMKTSQPMKVFLRYFGHSRNHIYAMIDFSQLLGH